VSVPEKDAGALVEPVPHVSLQLECRTLVAEHRRGHRRSLASYAPRQGYPTRAKNDDCRGYRHPRRDRRSRTTLDLSTTTAGPSTVLCVPATDWHGRLADIALANRRPITELALRRSGRGWWFADWMVLLTTDQVAGVLRHRVGSARQFQPRQESPIGAIRAWKSGVGIWCPFAGSSILAELLDGTRGVWACTLAATSQAPGLGQSTAPPLYPPRDCAPAGAGGWNRAHARLAGRRCA
jgi:hypothetical protein